LRTSPQHGVFGKGKASTPTLTVSFTLCRYSHKLSMVWPFTHIYITIWEKVLGPKGGESFKRLSKSPFLAINAKWEESIKPKAKGPHHHHHFKKIWTKVLIGIFSIGIYQISIWYQLVSLFQIQIDIYLNTLLKA
jgi:hypothetical protein